MTETECRIRKRPHQVTFQIISTLALLTSHLCQALVFESERPVLNRGNLSYLQKTERKFRNFMHQHQLAASESDEEFME